MVSIFFCFRKWGIDEKYGRSLSVGGSAKNKKTGKSKTPQGIFIFSNCLQSLRDAMFVIVGRTRELGFRRMRKKSSNSIEEKVSAASDGVMSPEDSDSWIGIIR